MTVLARKLKPPHSRYYSHVPAEIANHYVKTQTYENVDNQATGDHTQGATNCFTANSSTDTEDIHQYSVNLNNKYQENTVNFKVEDDIFLSHYSEIDKTSPRGSTWSTWPEDLCNTCTAQTYVNVSSREPTSFATPIPPPSPSVGPNISPSKSKSNCELAQSMNELFQRNDIPVEPKVREETLFLNCQINRL